jgi:1-acyl-sn-glycerol-3-phosphate acyltransferase
MVHTFVKVIYWLGGVIKLPAKDPDDRSLPEKLRGVLVALKHGDVVMIFPEGKIHSGSVVGEFAPGVIYVYRRLGAPIVPIATWMSERTWPRRRYVVQFGLPVHVPENLGSGGCSGLAPGASACSPQRYKTA